MRDTPLTRSSSPSAYESRKYPGVPNASPGTTATPASSSSSSASPAELSIVRPRIVVPMSPLTEGNT